jgi:hypothetical protein
MTLSADASGPLLRRGLLALAALTALGLAVELASERHWTQPIQLVAWAALGGLAIAIALVGWSPSRTRLQIARSLAVVVVLSAVLGVGEHVYSNYDAGALDQRYATSWDRLSEMDRWGLAVTKSVGPSPPFAPGAMAVAGLAVLLSTVQHPALARSRSLESEPSAT